MLLVAAPAVLLFTLTITVQPPEGIEVLSGEGKLLVKLGDGDVFGEIALLRSIPRTATVRTTTDTLVLVLDREVFLHALHADLALSARVEQIAAARSATGEIPALAPAAKS